MEENIILVQYELELIKDLLEYNYLHDLKRWGNKQRKKKIE
jgi:hypothetical protein